MAINRRTLSYICFRNKQAYFGYIASDVPERQFVLLACTGQVPSAVAQQLI
jgi:hypothetical protein